MRPGKPPLKKLPSNCLDNCAGDDVSFINCTSFPAHILDMQITIQDKLNVYRSKLAKAELQKRDLETQICDLREFLNVLKDLEDADAKPVVIVGSQTNNAS